MANAPSEVVHPGLPQREIDRASQRDAARASAEEGGRFPDDIEDDIGFALIEAVTVLGRDEAPPARGVTYVALAVPSGGSSDSVTLVIAHRDGDKVVLDCIGEIKPPFSSDVAAETLAKVLKAYRLCERPATGTRVSGRPPASPRLH